LRTGFCRPKLGGLKLQLLADFEILQVDASDPDDNVLFRSPVSTQSTAGDERFVKVRRVNPKNFFAELKRRNVYNFAIAYAIARAGLVAQQLSDEFLPC
jgi:hypothetical protein